jgi:hypothetical protein
MTAVGGASVYVCSWNLDRMRGADDEATLDANFLPAMFSVVYAVLGVAAATFFF